MSGTGRVNTGTIAEPKRILGASIAAAVIGGASLFGGIGTAGGALVGALMIGALNNPLDLLGVLNVADPKNLFGLLIGLFATGNSLFAVLATGALLGAGAPALAAPGPQLPLPVPQPEREYAPLGRPGPALQVADDDLDDALDCTAHVDGASRPPVLLIPGTTLTAQENFSWNYERAFAAFDEALPRGRHVAIVLPNDEAVDRGRQRWELLERHALRVHRSLLRNFCVFLP